MTKVDECEEEGEEEEEEEGEKKKKKSSIFISVPVNNIRTPFDPTEDALDSKVYM